MRIRADDPTAMKNFVVSVQNRVNEFKASAAGEQKDTSSKRVSFFSFILKIERKTKLLFIYSFLFHWMIYPQMEFMLEAICDIKNNKKRTKEEPAPHTRIKKWLQKVEFTCFPAKLNLLLDGLDFCCFSLSLCLISFLATSINTLISHFQLGIENILLRGIKWSKLLDPDKKGQWWLSGLVAVTTDVIAEVATTIDKENAEAQKMLLLASSQRMNTDARRAIFCIIMSGEDYIDAFEKLLRLDLPGKQVILSYTILKIAMIRIF